MQAARLLITSALVVALGAGAYAGIPAGAAAETDVCNPYPVGRCGSWDGEWARICYQAEQPAGVYLSPTDTNVVAIHDEFVPAIDDLPSRGMTYYVWLAPIEEFAADPWESDLPFQSVRQERNFFPGFQPTPFKCATFVWFSAGEFWMGPIRVRPVSGAYSPDGVIT